MPVIEPAERHVGETTAVSGHCERIAPEVFRDQTDKDITQTKTNLQRVCFPNKISGVGAILGLLVHVLPGPNKQRALELSMKLS